MTIRLSAKNLGAIAATVKTPSYDRARLSPGVVHFGVGNFHRAHQAMYLDALFNAGRDFDWAIVGAGVMPSDAVIREKLASQDYLTTLVAQEASSSEARVIGSMIDFLSPGDAGAIVGKLADPAYIAAQARERLGFVMPGDTPFQVQLPPGEAAAPQPGSEAAKPARNQPWYTALWHTIADEPHLPPAKPPPPEAPPPAEPGSPTG